MEFLQLLNDIKKRPNSYGLDGGYREYVAFFNGVNAATCGRLLEGFSEHLARKLGEGQNLYWALIVVRLGVAPREVRDINELREAKRKRSLNSCSGSSRNSWPIMWVSRILVPQDFLVERFSSCPAEVKV